MPDCLKISVGKAIYLLYAEQFSESELRTEITVLWKTKDENFGRSDTSAEDWQHWPGDYRTAGISLMALLEKKVTMTYNRRLKKGFQIVPTQLQLYTMPKKETLWRTSLEVY